MCQSCMTTAQDDSSFSDPDIVCRLSNSFANINYWIVICVWYCFYLTYVFESTIAWCEAGVEDIVTTTHGRSKWSGWSSFGPTTFSQTQLAYAPCIEWKIVATTISSWKSYPREHWISICISICTFYNYFGLLSGGSFTSCDGATVVMRYL